MLQWQTPVLFTDNHRFTLLSCVRYVPLSDCNRIFIFPLEFPVLPRKISAYLRPDSPSDANTRIMSGFYNMLNINYLHLGGVLLCCEKHHSGMRYGPFRRLKSTISRPDIGLIGPWNGHYQNCKRIIQDYGIGYVIGQYGPKQPI